MEGSAWTGKKTTVILAVGCSESTERFPRTDDTDRTAILRTDRGGFFDARQSQGVTRSML